MYILKQMDFSLLNSFINDLFKLFKRKALCLLIAWAYLACCVHQLQVVLLTVHRDHFCKCCEVERRWGRGKEIERVRMTKKGGNQGERNRERGCERNRKIERKTEAEVKEERER